MKYGQTERFKGDLKRLRLHEKRTFSKVVRETFVPAAERMVANPGAAKWPSGLRAKDVEGAPGIWEMTWSFSGSDGRATFGWREFDDEPVALWRRVGGHEIFDDLLGG